MELVRRYAWVIFLLAVAAAVAWWLWRGKRLADAMKTSPQPDSTVVKAPLTTSSPRTAETSTSAPRLVPATREAPLTVRTESFIPQKEYFG